MYRLITLKIHPTAWLGSWNDYGTNKLEQDLLILIKLVELVLQSPIRFIICYGFMSTTHDNLYVGDLGDLGLSKVKYSTLISSGSTRGTISWMAPELLSRRRDLVLNNLCRP
ncbi:hypothetical protein M5K25_019015 [Dendrobium thyrsiflorum]|uniref:Uncharacterized protein n=1 Tax=Dendrobium thyrsiflorum TaxID=117978 RepID=A0ABD0UKZ4_DENTH